MKKYWKIIVGCYLILLAVGSLMPGSPPKDHMTALQVIHNFLHLPAYALLAYLFLKCFETIDRNAMIWSMAFPIFYGILMEIGQAFVPNRYISFSDVIVNSLGVLFVGICVHKKIINLN